VRCGAQAQTRGLLARHDRSPVRRMALGMLSDRCGDPAAPDMDASRSISRVRAVAAVRLRRHVLPRFALGRTAARARHLVFAHARAFTQDTRTQRARGVDRATNSNRRSRVSTSISRRFVTKQRTAATFELRRSAFRLGETDLSTSKGGRNPDLIRRSKIGRVHAAPGRDQWTSDGESLNLSALGATQDPDRSRRHGARPPVERLGDAAQNSIASSMNSCTCATGSRANSASLRSPNSATRACSVSTTIAPR